MRTAAPLRQRKWEETVSHKCKWRKRLNQNNKWQFRCHYTCDELFEIGYFSLHFDLFDLFLPRTRLCRVWWRNVQFHHMMSMTLSNCHNTKQSKQFSKANKQMFIYIIFSSASCERSPDSTETKESNGSAGYWWWFVVGKMRSCACVRAWTVRYTSI